jgi:hypothetical protein
MRYEEKTILSCARKRVKRSKIAFGGFGHTVGVNLG